MSKRPAQPAPAPPSPGQHASTPPPVDVFRYLHVVNNQLIETTLFTYLFSPTNAVTAAASVRLARCGCACGCTNLVREGQEAVEVLSEEWEDEGWTVEYTIL